jgi:hypothetical protein
MYQMLNQYFRNFVCSKEKEKTRECKKKKKLDSTKRTINTVFAVFDTGPVRTELHFHACDEEA